LPRNNKRYSKSLHSQCYEKLVSMQTFGESKKKAKSDNTDKDKIFSFSTFKTYFKHIKYFIKYLKEYHPEVTTLDKARHYVNEFLDYRNNQNLSAWTIQLEAKALGKLFQISPEDEEYYEPPVRKRENITRSRGIAKRDVHFSEVNNFEFVLFCKSTGLRRDEIENLKGDCLISKDEILKELEYLNSLPKDIPTINRINILNDTKYFNEKYYVHVKSGKGGRERYSPIIGSDIQTILTRIMNTPFNKKVFEYVPSNADIHSYRSEYATAIYKQYARDIKDIPIDSINNGNGVRYASDIYVCRKDEAGKKLDKRAMLICSKALGHNRIEVVANNYIRGL